jgi:glycosyltransferase involved in cell wall biosynthesis
LRLYLVGEGEDRKHLEHLVQQLSLQNRVFLAGSRASTEIPLWFNAADLSILASAREGWPNVVLESLACGTPVIGTAVGQIPEILSQGDLGIVTLQDPGSLAVAMEAALNSPWDRDRLARFARTRPWETVAQEALMFLTSIVAEPELTKDQALDSQLSH